MKNAAMLSILLQACIHATGFAQDETHRVDGWACACASSDCQQHASDRPPCGCCRCTSWYDNLAIFAGLDGSKQPQDFGVNALFGGRFHVQYGAALWHPEGVGVQIGAAINASHNAVQVFERIEGSRDRLQVFSTVGFFQRCESGLNWGLVYDFLQQDYYDDFDLGQWRGQIGYELDSCTEVGARMSISNQDDQGRFSGTSLRLDPITQGSLFARRTWPTGVDTTFWVGLAEGHGEVNVVLGDLPAVDERLVFGADFHAPLNRHLAILAEANFIQPADTGTVDAYLGIVYYPGGLIRASRGRFRPLLPVANNSSFSVDLRR